MRAILALPLALALLACNTTGPGSATGMTAVDVNVTYRERILLPPGHVMTARIEDVSRAGSRAPVLIETRQPLDGRAPPYDLTLEVPNSTVDPGHTYAVRAEIRDAGGALRFTTDTRHAVLTNGAPNRADIVLVAVP